MENTNFVLSRKTDNITSMIKILSHKELNFLKELGSLIKQYNVLFSVNQQGNIALTVYEGEDTDTDLLRSPIHFQKNFDEHDIEELLEETLKRIKQLKEEHKDIEEKHDEHK